MSLIFSNCINQKYLYEKINKLHDLSLVDEMSNEDKIAFYKEYREYLTNEVYFVKKVGSLFWDITCENSRDLSMTYELLSLLKNPELYAGIENERATLIGIDDIHKSYIPRLTKKELMMVVAGGNYRAMNANLVIQSAYVLKLILLSNIPVVDEEILDVLESKIDYSYFTKNSKNWYGLREFFCTDTLIKRKNSLLLKEEQELESLVNRAHNIISSDKMQEFNGVAKLSRGHVLNRYLPLALEIIRDFKNGVSEEIIMTKLDVHLPLEIHNQFIDIICYFGDLENLSNQQVRTLEFHNNLSKAIINRL